MYQQVFAFALFSGTVGSLLALFMVPLLHLFSIRMNIKEEEMDMTRKQCIKAHTIYPLLETRHNTDWKFVGKLMVISFTVVFAFSILYMIFMIGLQRLFV